jgi:hypothetical protein
MLEIIMLVFDWWIDGCMDGWMGVKVDSRGCLAQFKNANLQTLLHVQPHP